MKTINLDQAATSFPKPPAVIRCMTEQMCSHGTNINRGGYHEAYELAEQVLAVREKISDFFNGYGPENVIFTANVTQALNMVLFGLLKSGDHVLISGLEHNAVWRPLHYLSEHCGITYDIMPADKTGRTDVEAAEALIRSETRAVICTYASNICPAVAPVRALGEMARRHGLVFITDAAQGAGTLPVDMVGEHIDILCFTGHKGLLGPQGTGGFLIRPEIVPLVTPVFCGGTGSDSHSAKMPAIMPDRYEPGTPNLPGILALGAAIDYINERGRASIHAAEMACMAHFLTGVRRLDGYRIIADVVRTESVPVVLLQCDFMDEGELAWRLDEDYGIMTRVGLHCAPLGHQTLGTMPRGGIRFSFGAFTTSEEVDTALRALAALAAESGRLIG
ncbi:MAG: aminotransferase class V-fold PLP-dependent enzyme [Eubacteriales bacterium]|nr:aminotransferase class V-fold PLP-dependent enzyme [Eubacteriales bacterium]